MSLQQLETVLKGQASASNGNITLNNNTFQQAGYPALTPPANYPTMDAFIAAALQLGTRQHLTVTTTVSDIIFNAATSTLTVTGTASFLNITAMPITLNFTGDTALVFNFFATLPTDWAFANSFDYLYGYPFAALPIDTPTYFFSTQTPTSVTWNGTPLPAENLQALALGLNFISNISPLSSASYLTAPLTWLKTLINIQPVIFSGSVDASTIGDEHIIYPNTNLVANIVDASAAPLVLFDGFLTFNAPTIGLDIETTKDKTGTPEQTITISANLTVTIQDASSKIPTNFRMSFIPNSSFITFSLTEAVLPTEQITLTNIIDLFPSGSVVINDIPTVLQNCLSALSLNNIVCDICLSTSPTLMAVGISIGSTKPWQFFNNFFTIETFNLSFRVLSPLSAPQKFISATANFLFSENANPTASNSLSFDVTITWDATSSSLSIAGGCNDSLPLTQLISDVLTDLKLPAIPQDTLNVTFEDFSIFISESTNNHQYSFSAITNADVNLFGHSLLNIQNLSFQLQVVDDGTKTYTANLNGIIMLMGLGFQISANIGTDTYLKINMANMTLGKLINFFVSLVSSGMQYHFPEPWNKLADINLDALVLEFDLTNKIISVEYNSSIDLEFINISSITLSYNETASQPEQKITIALTGNFLGQTYDQQTPLSWQPLNGPPPQVPGATSKFDLHYLGIGQHITFSNPASLTTVQAVLNELEGTMQPLPANPPSNGNMMSQLNGLKYDANSGWLLGIDCTVIETISLGVIFNDPTLYGLHLSLSGAKAKSFAGLSFEILYRKVTDDLGEYSLQLKLPNAMRHLQLGDAQITLPVIGVDIFTNGNFNVDFGFPYNHDFSQSFAILISPVVGSGGFYLGWLDGATATQMPQVTDGSFQPVIEFGFGLDVGLGASLSIGPLSAGISVTVLGILQGTFSYFEPTNKALPKDFFYQCQGMIGVQGRLWGEVNLCIIKASVDILIDAIASVTFECYQPTYLNVSADVNASVTIHFLFISVTHSFSAHIDQQFTLGSASTPPWHLASDSAFDSVSAKKNLCVNHLLSFAHEGPLLSTRLKATAPTWSWSNTANFCYNGVQNLPLYFSPTLSTTQTTALIIAALFIDSGTTTTTDPIATADFTKLCQAMLVWPLQAYFQTSNAAALNSTTIDHSDLATIYAQITASIPHNLFTKISGINETQSQSIWYTLYLQGYLTEGGEITNKFTPSIQLDLPLNFMTDEIETSIVTLITQWQSQAVFAYQDLSNYLAANFIFTIAPRPTTNNGPDNGNYPGTVFPMPSAITLTPSSNVPDNNPPPIDFSQYNDVSNSAYLQDLNEYLALTMGSGFQQKTQSSLHDKALADAANPSMAQLIFQDYFFLLIRTALQSAKNILKCYPYTIQASDTLESIATQYQAKLSAMVTLNQNDPSVLSKNNLLLIQGFQLLTQSSTTLTSIASVYQTGVLNAGIITSAAMQASDIANNNLYLKNLFHIGSTITLENINYTLPTAPVTQASLATQFYTQTNNILVLGGTVPQTTTTPLAPLTQVRITNIQFTVSAAPALNTMQNIAAYFSISPPDLIAFNPTLSSYSITATLPSTTSIAIPTLLYTVLPSDPTSVLYYFGIFNERLTLNINFSTVPIVLPQVIYTVRPNDSIFSIAQYLGVSIDTLLSAIASTPLTNNLSLSMPDIAHIITAHQTLHQVAAIYDIPVVQLASDNQTTQKCLTTNALWHIPKATITVAELLQTLTTNISNNNQATEIPVQNVSGMLNRFMLHGLCIPGPQTTFPTDTSQWASLPTNSLYALTGQQIVVNNSTSFQQPSSSTYSFNLQQNADAVLWLKLNSGDWPMTLTSTELGTLANILAQAKAVNFTLPNSVTSYQSANKTFNFQHSIPWQTSLAPTYLAASNPASTQTANPTLWHFPKALLAEVQNLADQTTLTLNLATTVSQHSSTQANTSATVNGYAWGSLFNLKVQKSKLTKGIYAINFDTAERHLLAKILNDVSKPTMQLFLLYPQNTSNGLISDIASTNDLQTIEVINTNLSLQTNIASCATLNNAQSFLQVLFEQSVMHGSTCYLAYRTQLQLQGLPDYLFSNSDTAKIKLLIVYSEAANVSNYHNCVITQTAINTQQQVFFAAAPSLLTTRSTITPGHFGFEWGLATAPTPDNYIGSLYHLLGYSIQKNSTFAQSPVGLPISPKTDHGGWQFKKILPIPGFQTHVSTNCFAPLPPAEENPYTYIVLNGNTPTQIQLSFMAQDIFGNQLVPAGLQNPLDINLYYTDPILGIGQWPGVSCSYSFSKPTSIIYCQIGLDFSVSRYNIAATEAETAMEMLKRLKADLKQYKTIYYQLGQKDVTLSLASSIGGEITDATLTTGTLTSFVSQIYTYLASLAYLYDNQQLASLIASISSAATWQDILNNYYVTSSDLATINQNNVNLVASNSTINFPICYTVQYQDTLNAISTLTTQAPFNQAIAVPVTQIATLNQSLDILETGTVLSIPTTPTATPYTIQAGDTLAGIAASFSTKNITVNDIATANAGLAQLFKQGAGIVLYTASQSTSTDNTLLTLAQMATNLSANQGQSITPAQLMQVNNTYTLANPGQIFIPQYLSLNISTPPAGLAVVQISSSNNSLVTLASNNNASIIDIFYANMNIVNILQTPKPVFTFNIIINTGSPIVLTPTVRTNETLNTFYTGVLNQIASAILNTNPQASVQLTIGSSTTPLTINLVANSTIDAVMLQLTHLFSLADFALLISTANLFITNSYVLVPATPINHQSAMTMGNISYQTLFQLKVTLTLSRSSFLINTSDPAIPQDFAQSLMSSATELTPYLGDAYQSQQLSLQNFSSNFSNVFSRWGLAKTKTKNPSSRPTLWVIPWSATNLQYQIAVGSQAFYLPPPLATNLLTYKDVPIYAYDPNTGIQNTPQNLDFTDIDLDNWAKQFLNAFDDIFSPQYLVALNNLPNGAQYLSNLLTLKQTLASTIADSILPVLQQQYDNPTQRLQQAQQALQEHLLENLSNAYNIDSIVQYETSVIAPGYIPALSLVMAAEYLSVPLPTMILASLYAQIQPNIMLDLPNNPFYITQSGPLINLLNTNNDMIDGFLPDTLPTEITNNTRLFGPQITLGILSTHGSGSSFNLTVPAATKNTLLGTVSDTGNVNTFNQNCNYQFNLYYFAQVILSVSGVYPVQTVNISDQGKTLTYTTKTTDSLQDIFNGICASATAQSVSPPSFLTFLLNVQTTLTLTVNASFTLYWQPVTYDDYAQKYSPLDLSPQLVGKPVANNYAVSQTIGQNTLTTITNYFSQPNAVPALYVAEVIQNVQNIFIPGSIIKSTTHTYATTPNDTLVTLAKKLDLPDLNSLINGIFPDTAFTDLPIFSPGKELNLSWISYGQGYCLETVAAALNVSLETLVSANLSISVYPNGQGKPSVAFNTYLSNLGYFDFAHDQLMGVIPYGVTSNITLLSPTAPIGVLNYLAQPKTGQNLIQVTGCDSVQAIATSSVFTCYPNLGYPFDECYIANLIKDQPGIFKVGQSITINPGKGNKTYSPTATDSLASVAEQFQPLSFNDFILQLNGNSSPLNSSAIFYFEWQYITLSMMNTQNVANTLLSISLYFQCDLADLISANLNTPDLLKQGTVINYLDQPAYTIKPLDTFNTLLTQLVTDWDENQLNIPDTFLNCVDIASSQTLLNPYAKIYLLKEQPGISLSSAQSSLQNGQSYLTFLFQEANEQQERVFLDLQYAISGLEFNRQPINNMPGYFDYDALTLLQPLSFDMSQVEIPVPLRSYPITPILGTQQANAYSPPQNQPLDLQTAKSWTYQYSYTQQDTSQDEIEICLAFNATKKKPSQSKSSHVSTSLTEQDTSSKLSTLFASLAEFVTVQPIIAQSLNCLISANTTPIVNAPQIITAVEAFMNLAQSVVTAWTGLYSVSSTAQQNNDEQTPIPYSCTVSEYVDTSSSPAVLNIIVSTQDNQVLPNGFNLPYIQADPTCWQSTLSNPTPPENSSFAVYSFKQISRPSANQNRLVQFFNEFDILLYQNVWAGISLERNAHLLSDIGTNPAFIYQTPEVRFSAPIVPLINRRGLVQFLPDLSFGSTISQQLQNYFSNLFVQLFGAKPTTNWIIELGCRYAYSLLEKEPDAYLVNVPIVFHAQWQLTLDGGLNQFIIGLVQNVLQWIQTNHITLKITAAFNFDISIFSPQTLNKPILHLHNVYVPCFPSPIQKQRILPPTLPSDPANLVNADGANPLVTDINQNTNILPNTTTPELLAYGDPVRVKSWISAMVWADNATLYYTGSDTTDVTTTTISRQQPVYADPLIGLYVCQLSGDDSNYNDYFSQSGQKNENDMSIYGDAGWQAGFHLSMPNPAVNVAAAYNSGQGPNTYNNDALIYNAGNNGQPWQPPSKPWIAATAASNTDTNPSNYSIQTPPASAYQVGLCQYGCWRDTLSVAPANANNDGSFSLAFAPNAARLVKQSDCHAEFLMANETVGTPNQALKMTMTQGSPFAQFVAAGVDAVRIAGIFKPLMPIGYVLTPGAISTKNTISGLSLHYVIIYQQVNFFNMEKITSGTPAQRMNWVAFAVYWDPTTTHLKLDTQNNTALYLTFTNPTQDNYFVVAGLPSQLANQFNPTRQPFSMTLAQPWANEIGQYAFNFITDTSVTYYVGQDKKGQPTVSNQVKTYYQWQFQQCGPVLTTDTSVMLLQPHHYATFCDGRNSSVLDNPPNFINFGANNKYWISRGKLEALVCAEFSTTYIYPNILPYLPYFNMLDEKPDSNNQNTYNLATMAAAMSGYDWVVEFPDVNGNQQNGPATTSMANTKLMQDSYNAVKGFLKAAKLIALLLQMAKTHYFDNEEVMSSIDGTLKTASPPGNSIYGVGNRAISATETETFTPGGALHDFIKHLMEAYTYYFNFNPTHLAQAFATDNTFPAKSYYYSYYDNANHHLFVYPAAGAGSNSWPTNVKTAGPRYDGYGTVSMLNDHAYTYGYLITAAGILGLVLKDPALQQLQYKPFNLATQSMDDSQAICSSQEWQTWSSWISNWTPIIDQLIMDIAYDPNIKGTNGFQMLPGFIYPKMEFFDPWSGAAWTDGFLTSGSMQGHNVNSPWEEMQAWAGILLWGHATNRPSIVNLGVYLYTTAFYSLEAYHYNTIKTYVPQEIGSDYGGYNSYLPKATNDFYPAFDMSWHGTYTPLANAQQVFTGKTMWDTMMSDTIPHQTAHVTYFYQGNVRSDTTYWNSPVGLQMTAIFPHTAYTLAMIRSHAYMIDWANAIQFQNSRSYYKVPYPTLCNLLYAQLGLNLVVTGKDCSGEYITQTYPPSAERTTLPIPYAETSSNVYSVDYGPRNNPGDNDVATNPAKNSFYYLIVDQTQTPYDWFWQKCSALNTYQSSGDKTNPPWISVSNCVTLSTYLSTADQSATEVLLYFYHYDRYGTLDFTVYASATPLIPETPIIQPMAMAWIKNTIRSFIIYNSNATEISVSFYLSSNPRQAITTQVIAPNSMLVWPTAAIYSFTASETVITSGEQVTLSWDVRDAKKLTLSNGADINLMLNQAAGTTTVNPTPDNPTYTLMLTDINGYQYQSQITFEFIAIQLFNIQPMYVVPNSMVTLTWQVSGAEKITITNGADYHFSSTDPIGNTSAQATLNNPSFTLTLYPSNTEVTPPTQTITVDFIQILSFTATPKEISPSGSVTLAWQVTGAKNITITNNSSIVTQSMDATGSVVVQPTVQNPTYILTLYPEGPGDFTLTQQVTIDFFQIISFTATPTEIEEGGSVTLNWQVSPGNNKGITITDGVGFNYPSPAAMGSVTVQPTSANPTYTLTLNPSDAGVQPLTQNLTIVFPQIQSFTATPSTIPSGNSSTLAWQVVGAAKINISDGASFNQDSTDATGSFVVKPTTTTTYTLTLYPQNNNLTNLQTTVIVTVEA